MAHGFLTPEDARGDAKGFNVPWKKLFDLLNNVRKDQNIQAVRVSEIQNRLEGRNPKALPAGLKMLRGSAPNLLSGNNPKALPAGQKALPPGGPKLPGTAKPPSSGKKGGTYTNFPGIAPDGSSGINPSSFLNKRTGDVDVEGAFKAGVSPSDLKTFIKQGRAIKRSQGKSVTGETAAEGAEALVKSRQEVLKTTKAASAPAISPDSGVDIVAAVNRNTEAIVSLVKTTKEQTTNDTKLTDRQLLVQEKMLGRQKAASEERSLEEGKDMSGFMTPTLKKIEKKMGAGPGGQGYNGQLGGGGPNVMDMLDIGSDIMDMRKGKVRRITQGRDGRTARQRLRDMRARRSGGIKPRGRLGSLSRLGGAKGGALGGLGGGLKGAARGLGKSGPLALLTAGLEFGDRMSSGQNAFQAGAGTAGSVGGGLAGAAAGAAIGSIVPGVGTVIGGLIGGMLGSMAGGGVADMATGANNIPSGAGGMLSSGPLSGYLSMLHGTELTLSGNNKKETKNIGEALGEGMIMASLGPLNPKVLELSAKGMKHYYEKMGGKAMFEGIFEGLGDIFKTGMQGIANLVHGLGGVLGNLTMGAAHAGTGPGGPVTGGNEDNMLAAYLSTLEGGSGQNAADAMQVMLNRAAQNHSGYGTNVAEQAMASGQFTPFSVAIHGRGEDQAANRAYGHIADTLGRTPEERKAKLRHIARTEGFAGLDRIFGKNKAQYASAVLQDFQQGGPMSALARKDVKGRAYFKGQSDIENMKAGDLYRGTGGNYFHDDRDLSKLAVGMLQNAAPTAGPGAGAGKTVVLAGGTNNYEDPQGVKRDLSAAIKSLKSKGYNVVVVAPNRITYPQANQAAKAAAIAEGATVEDPLYGGASGTDPLHLTPASVTAIKNKYPGAIFMGDSNAVRLNNMTAVPGVSKEGIPTGDIAQYAQNLMPTTPAALSSPPGAPVQPGGAGSKLEADILAFRQARTRFGVSGDRIASNQTGNLYIRELRGRAGGNSINPLADDLAYEDIHVSAAHKEGYGFDVPVANAEQANFVIDFFRSRGYNTLHGAQDPKRNHDHHVHVQAPDDKKDEFLGPAGAASIAASPAQVFGTGANPLGAAPPDLFGSGTVAAASPNTGTQMMATSAQVANAAAPAQNIVVNNNYYGTGGGGQTQVTPNNLTAGIGMNSSGLAAFQELRLRSLQ